MACFRFPSENTDSDTPVVLCRALLDRLRMDDTRPSLLIRVRDPRDGEAWRQFDELYRPLIVRFARAAGLPAADADDLGQECLTELVRRLPQFEYDRARGGFRRWLRVFVRYRVRNYFRKRREQNARTGDFTRPQDRESSPSQVWERIWLQEHMHYCLEQIRDEFEPQTYAAFKHYVLDEWPVSRVCEALGVNANQVYIAKSRVAARLRVVMAELLGDAA